MLFPINDVNRVVAGVSRIYLKPGELFSNIRLNPTCYLESKWDVPFPLKDANLYIIVASRTLSVAPLMLEIYGALVHV